MSVYLKADSPGTISIEDTSSAAFAESVSVTTEWQRFSAFAASNARGLYIVRRAGDTLTKVYAKNVQVEIPEAGRYISLTEQDETIPSEYVATTTTSASQTFYGRLNNTVASNVVTEAALVRT
jgi:hypothetical protein